MKRIAILIVFAALALIAAVGCSAADPLVGTWKLTNSDLSATLVFEAGAREADQGASETLRGIQATNRTLSAMGLKYATEARKATDQYKADRDEYLSSIRDSPAKVALVGVDRWGDGVNTEGAYEVVGGKLLIWFGEEAGYLTWWVPYSIDGNTMRWESDGETITLLRE